MLLGCGPTAQFFGPSEATTGGEEASDSSSDGTTTAAPEEPGSSGDESTTETPSNFIEHPDGGSTTFECDTFVQDCPAGHKCVFWANDGGTAWNATKCEPIPPDADEAGEPCTVEGNGATGVDSCEFGAMCWNVSPETYEGTCIAMCTGDESNPTCDDPDTRCVGRGPYLCLPTCCPVEQDCLEGQACYPVDVDFQCIPDGSGDAGGYGDPCEFINACNPGLMCLDSSLSPDCDQNTFGCCIPVCEVGSESCSLLNPELQCTPWYEEDDATPGLEHVGACTVPQ